MSQSESLALLFPNFTTAASISLGLQNISHKLCLSVATNIMATYNRNQTYRVGTFSYTASSINFTATASDSYRSVFFENTISRANNVPFYFYLIS